MARHYKKKYKIARALKAAKYSNETYGALFTLTNNGQVGTHVFQTSAVVPTTPLLGTRKCKNFTVRCTCLPTQVTTAGDPPVTLQEKATIFFMLIYLPEGLEPTPPRMGNNNGAVSVYEPNQNLILSGFADDKGVYNYKTRLARNLNAGDQILFVAWDQTGPLNANQTTTTPFAFSVNYAISF